METQFNSIIKDKTDLSSIELRIDNIIQSFQEIDRVVEQLVADNKASAPAWGGPPAPLPARKASRPEGKAYASERVEPFEFTSNGGGGEALLRLIKRREATFYEVIKN